MKEQARFPLTRQRVCDTRLFTYEKELMIDKRRDPKNKGKRSKLRAMTTEKCSTSWQDMEEKVSLHFRKKRSQRRLLNEFRKSLLAQKTRNSSAHIGASVKHTRSPSSSLSEALLYREAWPTWLLSLTELLSHNTVWACCHFGQCGDPAVIYGKPSLPTQRFPVVLHDGVLPPWSRAYPP